MPLTTLVGLFISWLIAPTVEVIFGTHSWLQVNTEAAAGAAYSELSGRLDEHNINAKELGGDVVLASGMRLHLSGHRYFAFAFFGVKCSFV